MHWLVGAEKLLCTLFTTVLFLPVLDFFLFIFKCSAQEDGREYHDYYTDVECYAGKHVFYAFMAGMISLIFVVLSFTVSVTFFECNKPRLKSNASARYRTPHPALRSS